MIHNLCLIYGSIINVGVRKKGSIINVGVRKKFTK